MPKKSEIFEVVDDEPETENVVMEVEEPPKEKKERKKREYTAEQKAALIARLKAGRERKQKEREGKNSNTKKPETKKEVKQEIKEVKAEIKEAKQTGNTEDMRALLGQLKILNNHFEKLSAQPKPQSQSQPKPHSAVAQEKPAQKPAEKPIERPKTPPMPKTEIYCSRTNTYRYI